MQRWAEVVESVYQNEFEEKINAYYTNETLRVVDIKLATTYDGYNQSFIRTAIVILEGK